MDEMHEVDITESGHGCYHAYTVFSAYAKDSVAVSPQGLLELAAWITQHRDQLEQEAYEDAERNQH